VIGAIGPLERPALPDFTGLDDFAGTIMHTARGTTTTTWPQTGRGGRNRSVGAPVIPEIARQVARLDVYQRTPIWVAPKIDFELGTVGRLVLSNPLVRAGPAGRWNGRCRRHWQRHVQPSPSPAGPRYR